MRFTSSNVLPHIQAVIWYLPRCINLNIYLRLFFNAHVYFLHTAFKRHTRNTRRQKANPPLESVNADFPGSLTFIFNLTLLFQQVAGSLFHAGMCWLAWEKKRKKRNAPSKLAFAVCLTSMYRSQAASETVCSLHLSFAGTQRGGRDSCLPVSTVVCL